MPDTRLDLSKITLFPFSEYWWFYVCFIALVLVLITIDLGVFQKDAKTISFRHATYRTLTWVSLALIFNILLYYYSYWTFSNEARLLAIPGFDPSIAARTVALEFLTGYVVEQSLSVDNIFVFVVVFLYFGIPVHLQHRILFYGILGALILRGIFIAIGSVLMKYEFVIWIFGAFLILTGLKMMFAPEKKIEPEKNPIIKLLKKFFPVTTQMEGSAFWLKLDGKYHMTPLFVALVFLELTDVVFAVDSVPAIFAITTEPLIVFTSNIFAILGLRSLYFLLSGAMDLFHFLKYGLAIVLMFVGLKMVWLNHYFVGKFPIAISLSIILSVIALSVLASLLIPKKDPLDPKNLES